ncbi:hypothetical protein ACS0TY_007380 [Phlomoides rotata]
MKYNVNHYSHSRRTTKVTTCVANSMHYQCDCGQWKLDGIPCLHALEVCRQYDVDPTEYVPECYSTIGYSLTYTSGFFAPLPDIEECDEPNFQLRHNPDRRIRCRGLDVTSMDWAQTRVRQ